ncbi:MAG: hypothetical protein QOG69_2554 [Actinomycetota bacterium]|jgi:hypothetical protein|nr:hypothetical protein [Actinomycetota bacterium]
MIWTSPGREYKPDENLVRGVLSSPKRTTAELDVDEYGQWPSALQPGPQATVASAANRGC